MTWAVLASVLLACESDDRRLERLQQDHATAVLERLRVKEHPEWPVDSTLAAERRVILSQRALDRFLAGR